jgi:Sporulation and spore germination
LFVKKKSQSVRRICIMKDGQEVRHVSTTAVIAGVCGLALVTGGGFAWWTASRSPTADTQSSAPTTAPGLSPTPADSPAVIIPVPPPNGAQVPQAQAPQVQTPQAQRPTPLASQALAPKSPQPKPLQQADAQTVQVYWVKDAIGKFEAVPTKVAVKQADRPDATLQAAFNTLLAGPKDATVSSEIPKGTKLRSLSVKNDEVYVDLSREFTAGGGSSSILRFGFRWTASLWNFWEAKVWRWLNRVPAKVLTKIIPLTNF